MNVGQDQNVHSTINTHLHENGDITHCVQVTLYTCKPFKERGYVKKTTASTTHTSTQYTERIKLRESRKIVGGRWGWNHVFLPQFS
jgi:hypothetical protein